MELRTIKKTEVACYNLKTNLIKLGETVGVVPAMIMEEIARQGIEPTGAQIWEYIGCDGDPTKEFTLKIAIPINKMGVDTDKISFEYLSEYKCVCYTHKGAWADFKMVYAKLATELINNGYTMNGSNREVYVHCDFENQDNCITEIQIGVL